jgi:signal transduction histidine kinase
MRHHDASAAHIEHEDLPKRDLAIQAASIDLLRTAHATAVKLALAVVDGVRSLLNTPHVFVCLADPANVHHAPHCVCHPQSVFVPDPPQRLPGKVLLGSKCSSAHAWMTQHREDWSDGLIRVDNLEHVAGICVVPVIANETVVGLIGVATLYADQDLTPGMRTRIEQFSSYAGIAWTNAQQYQAVLQREADLERRIAARTDELETLLNIANNLSSTFSLDELLSKFIAQLSHVVPFESSAIFVRQDDENMRVLFYQGPPSPIIKVGSIWQVSHHFKLVVEQQRAVVIPNTRADSPSARIWMDQIKSQLNGNSSEHIVTWMGVPIIAHNRVIGLLTLDRSIPNAYTATQADLATAVAQQAGLAIENVRLHMNSVQAAAAAERNRLSRDLHDSVSQAVYSMTLGVRTMEQLAKLDTSRVLEPLPHIVAMAEAALTEMRSLIYELRPELLETEGLLAALRRQLQSLRTRHSILFDDLMANTEPAVGLEVKEALYRLTVEALHNIVKHARASIVRITLREVAGKLYFEIVDDGIGFDVDTVPSNHFGLKSMRERIMHVRGQIRISSAIGKGTRISIGIPIGAVAQARDELALTFSVADIHRQQIALPLLSDPDAGADISVQIHDIETAQHDSLLRDERAIS